MKWRQSLSILNQNAFDDFNRISSHPKPCLCFTFFRDEFSSQNSVGMGWSSFHPVLILASYLLNSSFQGGSVVKNPPARAGDRRDAGLIPVLGRSPGGGNGNPLQYSCWYNPMDREPWRATYSPWGRKELDMTEQLTLLQELGIENPWTVAHQVPPSMRFFRQ